MKQCIEEKVRHDFLWKNIDKPVVDEDKLFILSKLVPKSASYSNKERDVYIITTMLVQIALDTHELVSDDRCAENVYTDLETQLHVLAGDYYSGLYYYLLSEIEDFQFINKLATAIKAINELKMKIYYKEYNNFNEYVDLKVQIDSLLLDKVAAFFNQLHLVDSIKQWFYLSLLLKEKNHLLNDDLFVNELLDVKGQNPYLSREDKFGLILDREWMIFNKFLKSIPHDPEFESYFNQKKMNQVYMNTLNVEEG